MKTRDISAQLQDNAVDLAKQEAKLLNPKLNNEATKVIIASFRAEKSALEEKQRLATLAVDKIKSDVLESLIQVGRDIELIGEPL